MSRYFLGGLVTNESVFNVVTNESVFYRYEFVTVLLTQLQH